MSTATLEPRVQAPRNYLNADYGWKSWLFTLDHKRIALLYMVSITFFFIVGGFVRRSDAHSPDRAAGRAGAAGDLQQAVYAARRGHDFLFS